MRVSVVFVVLLSSVEAGLNYCGAKMCDHTNSHTFCQYKEGPGPECTGYIENPLSGDEKARVLARLNRRRSEAAQGKLLQLPTAGNMLKLRWVEELAREAQIWADQCRPPAAPEEHDSCRDLYSITVGQCVASVVGEAPGLRPESMVDTWYLQGLQYRGNVSTYTLNNKRNHMDFAQMLWAQTYIVGCARSQFMCEISDRMRTVTRLVCNFGPRGPAGALWLPAPPAGACPPRSRPALEMTGLCEYQPGTVYGATNEISLEEQTALNAVLEIERNASLEHHGSLDEIYLTNIAIATLSQAVITESYPKYIQKQDIVEPIFLEEKPINIEGNNLQLIDEVIEKMVRERPITTTTKLVKRIKIVGRPKSYNIEDLSDEDKASSGKTRPPRTETTTLNDKDSYADYEFTELTEIEPLENISSTEMSLMTTNSVEFGNITTRPVNKTINETEILNMEDNVTNAELRRLLELSKKTEEHPSDPETARELQEALERMEQSLSAGNSGKVRRELRRYPEIVQQASMFESMDQAPQYPLQTYQYHQTYPYPLETSTQLNEELKKTFEKGSMLNSIFRYLPFMKGYESSFVGNSVSSLRPCCLMFVIVLFVLV